MFEGVPPQQKRKLLTENLDFRCELYGLLLPPPSRKYEILLIYYLHFRFQTAHPLQPKIKATVVRAFLTAHLGVWFSLFRVTSDGHETDNYASIIANSVFVEVEKTKKIAKKSIPVKNPVVVLFLESSSLLSICTLHKWLFARNTHTRGQVSFTILQSHGRR